MPYLVTALGDSINEPTIADCRRILHSLDPKDEEHGTAWIVDDDDNSLEWEVTGNLSLGPERPEVPCKRDGCSRGAVALSVFCAMHHHEQLSKARRGSQRNA